MSLMSVLTNESEADRAVINSLLRQLYKSKGDPMSDVVLYKDKDGSIKRVQHFENISREDIVTELDEAQSNVQRWTAALSEFDALNGSSEAAAPVQPVEAPQPNAVILSGNAELQPVELTVTPAAQVDTSVQPTAPAPVITDITPAPIQ